ncbi:hypothetical protein ACWC9U_38795, partial [Streptomyces sp. 900116325]
RSLALIVKVAEHTPRTYRIVLLSDHGQSPGEPRHSLQGDLRERGIPLDQEEKDLARFSSDAVDAMLEVGDQSAGAVEPLRPYGRSL